MASVVTSLPGQQPPPAAAAELVQPNNIPQALSSSSVSNWHSSGSIGPFFGVISVLAVVAILSCILGRVCTGEGRAVARVPPDPFKHGGYLRWMKRKGRWCRGGDVEVGTKVMALGDEEKQADVKTEGGEVDQQQSQP